MEKRYRRLDKWRKTNINFANNSVQIFKFLFQIYAMYANIHNLCKYSVCSGLLYSPPSPLRIILFQLKNRITRKRCGTCAKLMIHITEHHKWCCSGIFIVNFEADSTPFRFSIVHFEKVMPTGFLCQNYAFSRKQIASVGTTVKLDTNVYIQYVYVNNVIFKWRYCTANLSFFQIHSKDIFERLLFLHKLKFA